MQRHYNKTNVSDAVSGGPVRWFFLPNFAQDALKVTQLALEMAQVDAELAEIQHNLEKRCPRQPLEPPLGTILELKLAQVAPILAHVKEKSVSKDLRKTCCLRLCIFHRFFNEISGPGDSKNQAKPWEGH